MLKLFTKAQLGRLYTMISLQPRYAFGGSHDEHHEIDREKIRLSDKKTGTFQLNGRVLLGSERGSP